MPLVLYLLILELFFFGANEINFLHDLTLALENRLKQHVVDDHWAHWFGGLEFEQLCDKYCTKLPPTRCCF